MGNCHLVRKVSTTERRRLRHGPAERKGPAWGPGQKGLAISYTALWFPWLICKAQKQNGKNLHAINMYNKRRVRDNSFANNLNALCPRKTKSCFWLFVSQFVLNCTNQTDETTFTQRGGKNQLERNGFKKKRTSFLAEGKPGFQKGSLLTWISWNLLILSRYSLIFN